MMVIIWDDLVILGGGNLGWGGPLNIRVFLLIFLILRISLFVCCIFYLAMGLDGF